MTHAAFTPAVDRFRFYADGTESGSTPEAAENTNVSVAVDSNRKIHLRYRIQETGGASGATTDDYGLEFSRNGGAFTAVTASSSFVQADTASGLTDGAATTNRATDGIADGTGSFVAGEQEEGNGVIEDHQLTANNFTEHVWALLLIAADLGDGDTLDFRVTLNGGTPGMTNSVTPRITATEAPAQADIVRAITHATIPGTQTSYIRVPGMALRPQAAGAYLAVAVIETNNEGATGNQTNDFQIQKNGSAVGGADTVNVEIDATYGPLAAEGDPNLGFKVVIIKKLAGLVTSDVIDIKWKTNNNGSAGVSARSLHLIPVPNADDIIVAEETADRTFDTNGAWADITGATQDLTLTPGAGTYVAFLTCCAQQVAATEAAVNNDVGIHVNDTLVSPSLRRFFMDSSSAIEAWSLFAAAVVTPSAGQTVKGRINTATGTANALGLRQRALILVRVNAAQVVEKTATGTTTRNVNTYATLDSMTETIDGTGDPGPGDYDVIFSCNSGGPASGTGNLYTFFGAHLNGSLVTNAVNTHYHEGSHDGIRNQAVGQSHFLAITSGQTYDIRWRTTDTAGQAETYERSLIFWNRAVPVARPSLVVAPIVPAELRP